MLTFRTRSPLPYAAAYGSLALALLLAARALHSPPSRTLFRDILGAVTGILGFVGGDRYANNGSSCVCRSGLSLWAAHLLALRGMFGAAVVGLAFFASSIGPDGLVRAAPPQYEDYLAPLARALAPSAHSLGADHGLEGGAALPTADAARLLLSAFVVQMVFSLLALRCDPRFGCEPYVDMKSGLARAWVSTTMRKPLGGAMPWLCRWGRHRDKRLQLDDVDANQSAQWWASSGWELFLQGRLEEAEDAGRRAQEVGQDRMVTDEAGVSEGAALLAAVATARDSAQSSARRTGAKAERKRQKELRQAQSRKEIEQVSSSSTLARSSNALADVFEQLKTLGTVGEWERDVEGGLSVSRGFLTYDSSAKSWRGARLTRNKPPSGEDDALVSTTACAAARAAACARADALFVSPQGCGWSRRRRS